MCTENAPVVRARHSCKSDSVTNGSSQPPKVWIGQGSGYFPYPAESFMINQTPWIYWGLVLTAAGLIIIAISRKLRK